MPINSLYPSFVKIFYSANGHPHTMVLPVQMVLPAGNPPSLTLKNGTTQDWETCVGTNFVPLLAQVFNVASSFVSAEIWSMATPTADPVFVDAMTIGMVGQSGSPTVPYSQVSMTFRAADGGLFRLLLLEGTQGANARDDPPFDGAANLNISNFLIGATSFVCARSGGYLIAPIRLLTKTNDKLRSKFLLDA